MSSKDSLLQLQSALLSTGLVQPVDTKVGGGSVEVLSRQVPGQERAWLKVVGSLLETFEGAGDDLHICRRYLRKNGSMVFGWHLSITSKSAKSLKVSVEKAVGALQAFKATLSGPTEEELDDDDIEAAKAAPQPRSRPLAPGQHPKNRKAVPRAPGKPGAVVGTPPANFQPAIKVVQNTVDAKGKRHIVEEMPLPHVHREMNEPNEKGKGATLTGGG